MPAVDRDPIPLMAPDQLALWADSNEQAFQHAPAGMAVLERGGGVVRVNPALCTLLGVAESEIVGRSIADLAAGEHIAPIQQWIDQAKATAISPMRGEGWYTRRDGTALWLVADVSGIADAGEAPRYSLVIVHDRTANKVMEEALRRSKEELDALIDNAPVAIYKVDLHGNVLLWNTAAEKIFGFTARETLGRRLPIVRADQMRDFETNIQRILKGEPLAGREAARQRKDGTLIDLAIWTAPVHDSSGEAVAIMAVAADVTDRKQAEEVLRSSEHRFRTMVQNISDTITVLDAEGRVKLTTGQTKNILGYPTEWWDGRSLFDLAHPDDVERGITLLSKALAQPGVELTDRIRARHAAGHYEYVDITGVNLLDDPDLEGLLVTTHNVTAAEESQRLLSAQARILELIARSAPLEDPLSAVIAMVEEQAEGVRAAILLRDGDRLIPRGAHHLPRALLDELTRRHASRTGESVPDRPDDANPERTQWAVPIIEASTKRNLGVLVTLFDEERPLSEAQRRVIETASQLVSIAVERHEIETKLAHQGLHDTLTGLPNRTLLLDRLAHALTRASLAGDNVAVLFIDVDRFKVVNDSLGHGAGDRLLIAFADRLRSIVRPDDTLARFGGDEFVVLCEHDDGPSIMLSIADRLEEVMAKPFLLDDGAEVFLTVSMGLAAGAGALGADALLRNADAAMYRAKERGRNRLEVFDEAMRAAAVNRLNLGNDLRRALERQEFVVHYQPVVSVQSREVLGAEALVRWNHPTRGLLPPGEFIAVTEDTGMIVPLGEWVLHESLRQVKEWTCRGLPDTFALSVNLSARQLIIPDLADRVDELLAQHGWPAEQLSLELTESVLMDDLDLTLEALDALKSLGVRLAIDDFGTGYSSLTYLQRFPVDVVKIDQSFVTGLGVAAHNTQDDRGTIATAVVGMAHALGLTAVAEGVEHDHELAVLRALRCDQAQGYLFSRPLPAGAFLAFAGQPQR